MRVTIRQKNIKATPALSTYLEEKFLKPLRRLLKGIGAEEAAALDLELSRTTRHHRKGMVWRADAALTLPRGKEPWYAGVDDEDIHAAIDFLREEVEKEIKKYKGKSQALTRRGARAVKRIMRYDPAAQLPERSRVRDEGD